MPAGQKFPEHHFISTSSEDFKPLSETRQCNQELVPVSATALLKVALLSNSETVMCAGGQRKRRATAPRERRQAAAAVEEEEDVEAEFNPENPYQVSHPERLLRSPFLLLSRSHPHRSVHNCPFASKGHLRRPRGPGESSSQLCEGQQMPGSRRRGPGLSLRI